MRVEHLKEMNKLKMKFKHIGGVDGQDVGDSLDIYLPTSTRLESDATERGREKGREDALQKRIAQLEKDLAVSRGKSGRDATRSTTPTASRSTGRESDRERVREKERESERMKGRRESDRESEREREKGYSSTGSVGSRGNRSVPGQGEGRGERGGYSSSRSVSSTGRKRPSYNTGSLHSPTSASSARGRAGDRDRDRGHGGYMRYVAYNGSGVHLHIIFFLTLPVRYEQHSISFCLVAFYLLLSRRILYPSVSSHSNLIFSLVFFLLHLNTFTSF